ncbi:MAG: RHS domain-containing protein [Spirochaetales bacterium]|nr:RHS domain-containing protein [Spirochaetales bacterium]
MSFIYVFNDLFAKVEGKTAGDGTERKKYFYHTDHLGSTTAITDESGNVVWKNDFTPFGTQTGYEGTEEHDAKFTGKDYDVEISLYYFNARWYDPELGRFISQDPIKDGVNWFVYCADNPLGFVDPTGLQGGLAAGAETLPGGDGFIRDFRIVKPPEQVDRAAPTYKLIPFDLLYYQLHARDPENLAPVGTPEWQRGMSMHKYLITKFFTPTERKKVEDVVDKDGKPKFALPPNYTIEKNGIIRSPDGTVCNGVNEAWNNFFNEYRSKATSSPPEPNSTSKIWTIDEIRNSVGPGVLRLDTAAMSDQARKWQGPYAYRVLWKTKPSANMRDWVDFDDWDAGTRQLIDRKWNVTGYPKSIEQAKRQAAIAKQYGLTVRWEVPRNRLKAAQSLIEKAEVEETIEVIAPRRE